MATFDCSQVVWSSKILGRGDSDVVGACSDGVGTQDSVECRNADADGNRRGRGFWCLVTGWFRSCELGHGGLLGWSEELGRGGL
jgi:hypothetical protein